MPYMQSGGINGAFGCIWVTPGGLLKRASRCNPQPASATCWQMCTFLRHSLGGGRGAADHREPHMQAERTGEPGGRGARGLLSAGEAE